MQRRSLALLRGNAACVLGTVPSSHQGPYLVAYILYTIYIFRACVIYRPWSHGLDDLFYLLSIHNFIDYSIVILFICVILAVTVFFHLYNIIKEKKNFATIIVRHKTIVAI